jgi:hypothetical protein
VIQITEQNEPEATQGRSLQWQYPMAPCSAGMQKTQKVVKNSHPAQQFVQES